MNIKAHRHSLSGHITVPGSKSHTIRALLLATLAEGTSNITNPLPSADCLSTAAAVPLIGSEVTLGEKWTVQGAGKKLHIPTDVVNVGNSGSLLYFLAPIAATMKGWSVFTGDQSIRRRPVRHLVDVLRQMGAEAHLSTEDANGCPLIIRGPVTSRNTVRTEGSVSSQYITGLMMAALLLPGPLNIELTDPKETPYLTMTRKWLEQVGATVKMSPDFKQIQVSGPKELKAFDCTIPSDWEAVAFPLVAAMLTDSRIVIDNIDTSGTQGDDQIVTVLKSVGADIELDAEKHTLTVSGGKSSRSGTGRLSTKDLPDGILHIRISDYPDAICALAVAACFIEGTVIFEDADVCRRKETDRIAVLCSELTKLGAQVESTENTLTVHGHSPVTPGGTANPAFTLHGGTVKSYDDHRIAMSMACLGLALPTGEVTVQDAECCAVSFPAFFQKMNTIGAEFQEV